MFLNINTITKNMSTSSLKVKPSKTSKIITCLLILTLVFFCFKTTLRVISPILQSIPILLTSLMILLFCSHLVNKQRISIDHTIIYISICYFSILTVGFDYVSIYPSLLTPLFGIVQYQLMPVFWFLFYEVFKKNREYYFELIIRVILSLSIINSIGAIVQYFVSPDLFGLIYNKTYTASDLSLKINTTKRAISFISSPQSLGLFLAVSFAILVINRSKKKYLALNFIAGILTVSKIYILYLFVFLALNSFRKQKLRFFMFSIIMVIGIPLLNNDISDRFNLIFHIISDLTQYQTVLIWFSFITYETTLIQFAFGHGLGVVGNASQTYYNYTILTGSAESYLLQLYFETGIIGLFLFGLVYIKSILNFSYSKKYFQYSYILIALSISLIGTPAFFGFFSACFYYSIIVFGFLLLPKKKFHIT